MPQPPYGGYPPPASTGFSSGWDQTSNQPTQQAASGTGYDYYSQQTQQQQQQPVGGSSAPAGSANYNYGQPLPNYTNQVSYSDAAYTQTSAGLQGYGQDGYSGGYNALAPQPGYSQPASNPQTGYDQQGYGSTPGYGTVANPTQDGSASAYGAQGGSTQAPPTQQAPPSQPSATQGYTGQPPSSNAASYPTTQGTTPSAYGIPPTSQPGYGSQPPALTGYGQAPPPSYGQPSPVQKPPATQYGQGQQSVSTQAGYMQTATAQPGYGQPPSQSGYGQQQSYGGYGQQQQQPYSESYVGSSGYSQPPAYSNDNAAQGAYDGSAVATPAVSSGATVAKPPAT
ncbi:hypothetical protein GW17_00052709 [Ensete ventricosum]|nr:hypothetical protein GW17_00052709 [Ensete ventricosum]